MTRFFDGFFKTAQRNDNWESFLEQVRLIKLLWYLLKIKNYVCIRITCIYTPLTFISLKGGLQE